MPGDDEKQVQGKKLRQGAATPNEERSAPRHVRGIQRADPLWARFSAGALTLSLTATSAAVPSNDAFLNSTSRINNGVTMPATQIEAPQGLRASAEDIGRLSSDANVSRIAQSGNQNLLLTRVNDLLAALDGTGQPFRREMLLGGVRDQQAWADRYSTLTEAQKRVFIDQAIAILAENFGDQFSTGQAVRINEAFGAIVQQNLEPMFAQATAPAQVAATPVPWYQQIPVVREIASLFTGAQVVPTPTTVAVGEGEAFEITEDSISQALSDLGFEAPDEVAGHILTTEELMALSYLNVANTFFNTTPPTEAMSRLPELREQVHSAASAVASASGRTMSDEQVDSSIERGLQSLSLVFGAAMAGLVTTQTNLVQSIGRSVYSEVYGREYSRLVRERVPAEAATTDVRARAFLEDPANAAIKSEIENGSRVAATQRTQQFLDAIRAPGQKNIETILQGLGIENGRITDVAFYGETVGERDIGTVLRRVNEIISDPTLANQRFVDMRLSTERILVNGVETEVAAGGENAFRCVAIRNAFFRGIDNALFEPFKMIGRGLPQGTARAFVAGTGRTIAAFGWRVPSNALTSMRTGTLGEGLGAGAVAFAWVLTAWGVANELSNVTGLTSAEWGPIDLLQSAFSSKPAASSAPRTGALSTPAPTAATAIERDALTAATAFRDYERNLGNTSFRNLREELLLFENYILGGQAADLSTPAALRRIAQNRGAIEAAQEFLNEFNTQSAGMGQDQAALLFYKMFFERYGPSGLAGIIEAYVPEAERMDIYSYLFSQVALKSPTRAVLDATLFDKLRAQPRFAELTGPMLSVVEATLNWEGARSRRAGAVGAEAYMDALAATVGLMESSDNPLTAAVAFAEQNLAEFRTTLSTIKASITNEADRLDAYVGILRFLSAPENANISDANLERQFLLQQLDRYPNLRSAVETYFYNDAAMLRKASIYITQLTRDAASEPGVSDRGPTEVDVENLLRRRLSQNPSVEIRNLLDVVYLAEEGRRGRAQFDVNRFTMLVDAAVFLSASPRATVGQLKQHFIDAFDARYPGLAASTVQPDRHFDLVAALLPLRDSRGATLSPEAMLERANGTEYWSYRTDEWLNTNFAALPPAERASSFISLPEALQIEYWNAHPDEREDLYTAAKKDRAWNSAHGTDLRGRRETRGRGRSRTTVTVYPEWE